jgi:2-polyprenyl-6-methoxyphenol hydroxylase-like FAD-dependent oxidoreductase
MSNEHEADVDVLIQGAGIGGLTMAIALAQRGYGVRVVERSKGLSEIGAGIWMAPNPMQVFGRLGFADKIAAAGWAIHRIVLQDFHGDVLQASDISAIAREFGFETIALHRAVLQKVLFEQLPPGIISFGTEVGDLTQAQDSVTSELTDGTRVTAKVVIGADGVNSRIRELVSLGGEKRYSGSSSYRAIARGAQLVSRELEHDAYEIWGEGCRVGFSKINATDYYWYMTFESPAGESFSLDQRRAHAESLFKRYFPDWINLLHKTGTDEVLQTDISDLKRLSKWSSHRVGLMGDAAHATTPNLGQGAAMAIEDALVLLKAFEEIGLDGGAFEHYEKQRRAKVDWTVKNSWVVGRLCHIRNPLLRSTRNMALRWASRGHEKQVRKLYAVD